MKINCSKVQISYISDTAILKVLLHLSKLNYVTKIFASFVRYMMIIFGSGLSSLFNRNT
jgi:hypothetical protein